MVPWFHPIFGKVEPWNHGTQVPGYTFWVPGYTFWVPWFHGSTQNFNVKIQKFCWVEPWNYGTKVPGYTFEVPWFHGSTQFFLGGTMEPWNLGSRLHKKGSMVPWFQGGTMEPKCVICLLLLKYKSDRLPDPTGGSPDVVHLLKYVSLIFG